jgi:hypothetical protein
MRGPLEFIEDPKYIDLPHIRTRQGAQATEGGNLLLLQERTWQVNANIMIGTACMTSLSESLIHNSRWDHRGCTLPFSRLSREWAATAITMYTIVKTPERTVSIGWSEIGIPRRTEKRRKTEGVDRFYE